MGREFYTLVTGGFPPAILSSNHGRCQGCRQKMICPELNTVITVHSTCFTAAVRLFLASKDCFPSVAPRARTGQIIFSQSQYLRHKEIKGMLSSE